MTRRRFKVSKEAKQDLDDAWFFIAERNPNRADQLLDEIEARFLMLVRFPEIGVSREELAPQLRSFPVSNYLIFYRLIGSSIEIVRVLHGSRDVEQIFRDEEVEPEQEKS